MAQKLTDKLVRELEAPATGNRVTYDTEVKGFGVRTTAAGAKAFVLNYRAGGRERRYTIGAFGDWLTIPARNEAKRLKRLIDQGSDPMGEREHERQAPTVADLAARYDAEHLPSKRTRSADEDRALIRDYILPAIGRLKVVDVTDNHIAKMHREITAAGKPYRANRALACATTMFNRAIGWKVRTDNPCRGVRKNPEDHRERFLSPAELARLAEVLDRHPERTTVALIRFLMMTGCRKGEAVNATWAQFDLERGIWTKPSAHTKQKKLHALPLNAPALALLAELKSNATGQLVFPSSKPARNGSSGEHPITSIKTAWKRICRDAQLEGLRLHDLRHTFASVLASSGTGLQLIGSLLGHTQIATTMRYAHLADDARREAAERAGAVLAANGRSGEVIPMASAARAR